MMTEKEMLDSLAIAIAGKGRYFTMTDFEKNVYGKAVGRLKRLGDELIAKEAKELELECLKTQVSLLESEIAEAEKEKNE